MAVTLAVLATVLTGLLALWVMLSRANAPHARDSRRAIGKE